MEAAGKSEELVVRRMEAENKKIELAMQRSKQESDSAAMAKLTDLIVQQLLQRGNDESKK